MRAKSVTNKGFVFDFDETLFKTDSKVHVYDNDTGKYEKSLSAEEFNKFKKLPWQFLDFQDFVSNEIISRATPYKALEKLREIDFEISQNKISAKIYILTARTPHVQKGIYDLLKSHGIKNIKANNIICMGDGRGEINIAEEKKKILKDIKDQHDMVYFYDDDEKNIKAGKKLGIKTYLIEEYIKK